MINEQFLDDRIFHWNVLGCDLKERILVEESEEISYANDLFIPEEPQYVSDIAIEAAYINAFREQFSEDAKAEMEININELEDEDRSNHNDEKNRIAEISE